MWNHSNAYGGALQVLQAGETAFPNCSFGGCRIAGMFLLDFPQGLGEGEVSSGLLGTWGFGIGVGVNDGLGTASHWGRTPIYPLGMC